MYKFTPVPSLSWHTLVVDLRLLNWFNIETWLIKHCEGQYIFTTNIIKFELESDLIMYKIGYTGD